MLDQISLEDASSEKELFEEMYPEEDTEGYEEYRVCPVCHGDGEDPDEYVSCMNCYGEGVV